MIRVRIRDSKSDKRRVCLMVLRPYLRLLLCCSSFVEGGRTRSRESVRDSTTEFAIVYRMDEPVMWKVPVPVPGSAESWVSTTVRRNACASPRFLCESRGRSAEREFLRIGWKGGGSGSKGAKGRGPANKANKTPKKLPRKRKMTMGALQWTKPHSGFQLQRSLRNGQSSAPSNGALDQPLFSSQSHPLSRSFRSSDLHRFLNFVSRNRKVHTSPNLK